MPLFKTLLAFIQSILLIGVVVLSVEHYDPHLIRYVIPFWVDEFVIIGVIGVSAALGLFHVVSGGLLGATSGGFKEGLWMGLILGLGIGVSRLWPHIIAWGIGCFVAQGPQWHIALLIITSIVLLALSRTIAFFWSAIQNGDFS